MNDRDDRRRTVQELGAAEPSFAGGSAGPAGPGRLLSRAELMAAIVNRVGDLPRDSPVIAPISRVLSR